MAKVEIVVEVVFFSCVSEYLQEVGVINFGSNILFPVVLVEILKVMVIVFTNIWSFGLPEMYLLHCEENIYLKAFWVVCQLFIKDNGFMKIILCVIDYALF